MQEQSWLKGLKKGLEKTILLVTLATTVSSTTLPLMSCSGKYVSATQSEQSSAQAEQEEPSPKKSAYAIEELSNEEIEKLVLEGKAVNYIPKLPWDLENFQGFEIFDKNSEDKAIFIQEEQDIIKIFFNRFYINGKRFPVEINTKQRFPGEYYPQEIKKINGEYLLLTYGFKQNKVVIYPTKFLDADKDKIPGGIVAPIDINFDGLLDSGFIRLKEQEKDGTKRGTGFYNLCHETWHLLINDKREPSPQEEERLKELSERAQRWYELKN